MLGKFSKGKIEILTPKVNYAPGETISGTVQLNMKKTSKARDLNIYLMGVTKVKQRSTRRDSDGNRRDVTSTKDVSVYSFEIQLDGEKEYSGESEYPFEMTAPTDARQGGLATTPVEGAVMRVLQTAATFINDNPNYPVKWYLFSKLDFPGGFDVKKKKDIGIG